VLFPRQPPRSGGDSGWRDSGRGDPDQGDSDRL